MEYRLLGKSGLRVSEIGLGTNNFGWNIDEQKSAAVINHALELGINFIDTADIYGRGSSEEFIGKALKGKRSDVIIATKFGMSMPPRLNEGGGSRHWIMKAIDASLRRLNTDYIDLYYLHRPDPATPIEETLGALNDLVRAGKVRYIGCSNLSAWQLVEALWTSKVNHLESFVVVQSQYNLLERKIDEELVPCCQAYGVGIIPWTPLAGGFLTGKFQRGKPAPAGTRLANPPLWMPPVLTDANFDKLDKIQAFATGHGYRVGEVAIAWLLSHPWLNSVIAGATTIEQVSANVAAAGCRLSQEEAADLEQL